MTSVVDYLTTDMHIQCKDNLLMVIDNLVTNLYVKCEDNLPLAVDNLVTNMEYCKVNLS